MTIVAILALCGSKVILVKFEKYGTLSIYVSVFPYEEMKSKRAAFSLAIYLGTLHGGREFFLDNALHTS